MQNNRKKPLMVSLVAALVMCIVTFILGFSTSSFVLLDSRLEDAQEKISSLNEKIKEKESEIKALNESVAQKNENNVVLGEKIQTQAAEIESLKAAVSSLEKDVTSISEAAIIGLDASGNPITATVGGLSLTQQLIVFVGLFVLVILIISITCSFIASKNSSGKSEKKNRQASTDSLLTEEAYNSEQTDDASEAEGDSLAEGEEIAQELTPAPTPQTATVVDEAIDLLYHNNLEDSISDLGGFKFGITNFDEVLSDKSKGKAFGNSENGDFVAFMATVNSTRKLYIIPRYLTLSDSTVALRGTTDLFNVIDEGGNRVSHGTVRVKSIDSPAVFACGENGWGIEAKGVITAVGNSVI